MDPVIEYYFGDGGGDVHRWSSPADLDLNGDGTLDAVSLDFDGDGLRDDAMWDTDGDGRCDLSALDLDDDGTPEARFADDGTGIWGTGASGPSSEGTSGEEAGGEGTGVPGSPGEGPRETLLDTDDDTVPDIALLDTDGDGYADGYREVATGSSASGGGTGPSAR